MKTAKAGVLRKVLTIVALVMVSVAITTTVALFFVRNNLKQDIIDTLREKFQSDVQIGDLQIIVFPHVLATARGIVMRIKGRTDVPPLITIQELTLSAGILNLFRRHVSSITLQGLQIHVPPRMPRSSPNGEKRPRKKIYFPLVIDEIVSENALLETLPSDPKHIPRDFNIYHLVLHSFSFDNSADFRATLTNPQPLGNIDTQGKFGPWIAEEPGDTNVSGTFHYSHADFSSINGLSGIMSSTGKYDGTLDTINVEGDTEMPDFALGIAGNPMRLTTHYIAVVDGTNGDTHLKSVEARLGNSPLSVSGDIIGTPGIKGKHIVLDATSQNARAEDLIGLAVKGGSPMNGSIHLHAKIDLPQDPGKSVVDRLALDGQFGIGNMQFTNSGVQDKLDSLSRAGRREPKNQDIQDVISDLAGKFAARRGVITLKTITFHVPGAGVQLDGFYNMKSGDMDFRGHLLLDDKLSQTTTGATSVFLRLVDPFFKRKGGGSSIPIKVTGNYAHPSFGIDLGGNHKGK